MPTWTLRAAAVYVGSGQRETSAGRNATHNPRRQQPDSVSYSLRLQQK